MRILTHLCQTRSTITRGFMALFIAAATLALSTVSLAQETNNYVQDSFTDIGDHTVNYTVFNSLFVPANIAGIHTGTAKNLIQQSKALAFKTIKEPDAQYYIAPLRHWGLM